MAEAESTKETAQSTERPHDPNCIFCKIVDGKTDTELLYNDDDYVCFRDIHPRAHHHYLVVPKAHLLNVKRLSADHVPVVEKMAEIGREVLQQQFNGDCSDSKLGYHWPPMIMIEHLHLHVMAPESEMSFFTRSLYFGSLVFVNTDWTVKYLLSKGKNQT